MSGEHWGGEHWDSVYEGAATDALGWYEPTPSTLPLVLAHSTPEASVIDVGGGTSSLVGHLIDRGCRDLTVLDLSASALAQARAALDPGRRAAVEWIEADVRTFRPDRTWQVWHDRAVFHFLVDSDDRVAYRAVAASAVAPGGTMVVATFSPDGPDRCAGLAVRRYDIDALAAEFAPEFELVEGRSIEPASGDGDQRPYVAAVLRRAG